MLITDILLKVSLEVDTEIIKDKSLHEFCELLSYNPETGEIRWVKNGKIAGGLNNRGYCRLSVKGKSYLAHRLIWTLMTGEDAPETIDHIDGNKSNNRWANLRESDTSTNNMNRSMHKNNTSGVKCVSWSKHQQRWRVQIGFNKKYYTFGSYIDIEEAKAVADRERKRLHGEFANDGGGCAA